MKRRFPDTSADIAAAQHERISAALAPYREAGQRALAAFVAEPTINIPAFRNDDGKPEIDLAMHIINGGSLANWKP